MQRTTGCDTCSRRALNHIAITVLLAERRVMLLDANVGSFVAKVNSMEVEDDETSTVAKVDTKP
jgi:hypothetical protein